MTRLITKCVSTLFGFTTCLVTAAKAAVTLGMVRRAVGNIDGTPGTITWTYIRNVFPTHDVPTRHIIGHIIVEFSISMQLLSTASGRHKIGHHGIVVGHSIVEFSISMQLLSTTATTATTAATAATGAKAAVTLGMVQRAAGNIDGTPGTITWTYIRNVFPTHDVPTHHIIAVG
jgi:hypothetical protein